MSQTSLAAPPCRTAPPLSGPGLGAAFAPVLAASALLLFSVQPMVSRMVLPLLGGSPAVWNTCVCFFQAMLLAGYAYADGLARRLTLGRQVAAHAMLLLAAFGTLPLHPGGAAPAAHVTPALWLLGHLAVTVGLPFFALSATAPLLQHWFSRTVHPQASDPYFLYAASNGGSLVALLAIPFILDPLLGLSRQAALWSGGFIVVAAGVTGCGALAWRMQAAPAAFRAAQGTAPGLATQLRWMALAFVPSGLMLAVTTYITTDIASAPLFWVIPLAIYIATFVWAFGRRAPGLPRGLSPAQAWALAAAGIAALMGVPSVLALAIALLAFTLTAALCHLDLAARRPEPAYLTRYYLLISAGGALGGVFNALLAPVLFPGPWEYPLLLIAACAIRARRDVSLETRLADPPPAAAARRWPRSDAMPQTPAAWRSALRLLALLAVGGLLIWSSSGAAPDWIRPWGRIAGVALPAAALLFLSRRGAYLGIGLASLLILPLIVRMAGAEQSARSFFGTYRIVRFPDQGITVLQHGTTLHGVQGDKPGEETIPLGYYAQTGAFGSLFHALRDARGHTAFGHVGIIGLGSGALGCYAQPGESWDFREIDPLVEKIARNDAYFHFLHHCGNNPPVILGDARLTLARDTGARYDLLIIDAFSSDSIPMHLLTREALALYRAHLAPGGVIAFHISNRFLNLLPFVTALAHDAGTQARHILVVPPGAGIRVNPAELVALSDSPVMLDALTRGGWDTPRAGTIIWTDEQSDIARALRW